MGVQFSLALLVLLALGADILLLLFWLIRVSPAWVRLTAENYAARLVEAVDDLYGDHAKATAKAQAEKARKATERKAEPVSESGPFAPRNRHRAGPHGAPGLRQEFGNELSPAWSVRSTPNLKSRLKLAVQGSSPRTLRAWPLGRVSGRLRRTLLQVRLA